MAWFNLKRSRSKPPDVDPTSIGNIFLHHGFITPIQLRKAIDLQQTVAHSTTDRMLGELLVASGAVTRDQLVRALEEQLKMRNEKRPPKMQEDAERVIDLVRHRSRSVGSSLDALANEARTLAGNKDE